MARFRRGDARRRVLKAAARLFARKGFAGTSVGEIAAKASASPSSIYHHFSGGKDAILLAVLDQASDAFVTRTLARVAEATSPAEKAEAFLVEAQTQMENTPEALRILMQMALERADDNPEVRRRLAGIFARYRDALRRELDTLVAERVADRTPVMATILLGALQGIFLQWQLDPEAVDLDAVFDRLRATVRAQLAGLTG